MANMFSGNQEKQIPKTFKDCYKTDNITQNLWLWCERLERWGLRICIFLGIIGIISIISDGIRMGELLDELNIDTSEINSVAAELGIEIKSVFEVVVEDILLWSFYCFLEYFTYHILALLIGSLATIVQSTKITANIELYKFAIENKISIESNVDQSDKNPTTNQTNHTLRCEKCNNMITSYPCAHCGHQDSGFKKQIVVAKTISKDAWICPECCRENINGTNVCKCGYKYDSDDIIDDFTPCKYCGADISNDVNFCHVCGAKF